MAGATMRGGFGRALRRQVGRLRRGGARPVRGEHPVRAPHPPIRAQSWASSSLPSPRPPRTAAPCHAAGGARPHGSLQGSW
jgi:hypothetical protein